MAVMVLRRCAPASALKKPVTYISPLGSGVFLHKQSIGARMFSSLFREVQHTIKGHHSREYRAATKNGDQDQPVLSVKQYIPLNNLNPQPGDATIVAAHANGFPKELYEPLWYAVVRRMASRDLRIRSIWIADMWNQGESGVLNEQILGNGPSWFDHSRDLMNLINLKKDEIPHPIVGIGHSMGATQLAYLSLLDPRLLHSLVLLDPVIQLGNAGVIPGVQSTSRRDVWPSREEAAASFNRSKFYRSWDPRVFDLWIKNGLRVMPTELHPIPRNSSSTGQVTLTTSKHQELFLYLRPKYRGVPGERFEDEDPVTDEGLPEGYPFYRPEPNHVYRRLPELRPSVLYVFGDKSHFSAPKFRKEKLAVTGVGVGGSGGVEAGRVQETLLDCGHMIPMERVEECADTIVKFLVPELARWRAEQDAFDKFQQAQSRREQMAIDARWEEKVRPAKHRI